MHVHHLFTRYPHTRYGRYGTFADLSPDLRIALEAICGVLALVGIAVAVPVIVTMGMNGKITLASPLVQWGWMLPSIIMTPFIIWRIVMRSCVRNDGLTFGNFIFRDVYIPQHGFTFLHVLMYLVLAYCPFVNVACVLAGMVSIARCDFSMRCPRIISR